MVVCTITSSYNAFQKSIYILTCIKISKNKWQSCLFLVVLYKNKKEQDGNKVVEVSPFYFKRQMND